jgi:hypothetical protein
MPTPTPTPPVAEPPAPVVLPPPFPSDPALITGLRQVTAVSVGTARVAFSQYAVAPGRLRWTLDISFYMTSKRASASTHKAVGKPIQLAVDSRVVAAAGTVKGRLKLGTAARKRLKRHTAARLVLRTTLTLESGRVLRTTKTLAR